MLKRTESYVKIGITIKHTNIHPLFSLSLQDHIYIVSFPFCVNEEKLTM